jgi:hypothetical protein
MIFRAQSNPTHLSILAGAPGVRQGKDVRRCEEGKGP